MPAFVSRDRLAVLAALVAPLAVAAVLVPFRSSFPNTDAALAMLLVVVAVAANGYRLAGILAAVSVAVWFDFFLTQPYERFSITRRTDIETTILLLVIGIAVTEIAVWGRRQHGASSRRAGYLDGISSAAQAVAAGGSAAALIEQVTGQLTQLRAALLATAGPDLRTPLAAAQADVGELRSYDVTGSPSECGTWRPTLTRRSISSPGWSTTCST